MSQGILVTLALLVGPGELERAREQLAAGNYRAAWETLERESDEPSRFLGQAEVRYRAGDPSGALLAARAGLLLSPEQLDLLYYASGSAIWLGDGPSAVSYSERLLAAVGNAATATAEEKRKWSDLAAGYLVQSRALVERDGSLARAESLLRIIALGGIALWTILLLTADRRQGKSSKPVS